MIKSHLKSLDKYTKYAYIVIALGIILRFSLAFLNYPAGDSCWHLSIARYISRTFTIPAFEPLGRDVFWIFPVFHVAAAAMYKIFSAISVQAAEFGMKLVSPFLGSVSLFLVFRIAEFLNSRKVAFYAVLFMAFLPISLLYGSIPYLDATSTFFSLLGIYLALRSRFILSGLCVSVAILTKYISVFILPVMVYLIYAYGKDRKKATRSTIILLSVAFICTVPWLVRNYLLLGNPIWPFFTSLFGGYTSTESFADVSIANIFHLGHYAKLYLESFGLPNGSLASLSFVNLPLTNAFFALWLCLTAVFALPLAIGIFSADYKRKSAKALVILAVSFLIGSLFYIINVNNVFARYSLPAFISLAIFWAMGMDLVSTKLRRYKNAIFPVLILFTLMFSLTVFAQFYIGRMEWERYSLDFDWVRQNTPDDAVFMTNGQCVQYNLDRFTALASKNLSSADYIWYNPSFRLEPNSILPKEAYDEIKREKLPIAYEGKDTMTVVYRAR